MKRNQHPCPIAWYIGNFFSRKRCVQALSEYDIAQQLEVSPEYIRLFEAGKLKINALHLVQLEKIFKVEYEDYKPPVSYFGFLGLYADERKLLMNAKSVSKRAKNNFNIPHLDLENKILKLRYSPIRGKIVGD